jgi:hypothetical protein
MPIDRDRLRELTERIQVGDTDEGADALEEAIGLARDQGQLDRGALRQAMNEEMAERRRHAENDAALGAFKKEYPKLAEDEDYARVGIDRLGREIVADLKSIGVKDEDIAPVRHDINRLVQAHNQAYAGGAKVRSTKEVLKATGEYMTEKFRIPRGPGRSREEILRETRTARGFSNDHLDEQSERAAGPEGRGARRTVTEADPSADRERVRRIIEQQRKARGFPPLHMD